MPQGGRGLATSSNFSTETFGSAFSGLVHLPEALFGCVLCTYYPPPPFIVLFANLLRRSDIEILLRVCWLDKVVHKEVEQVMPTVPHVLNTVASKGKSMEATMSRIAKEDPEIPWAKSARGAWGFWHDAMV